MIVLVLEPSAGIEAGLGVRVIDPDGGPEFRITDVLPVAVPPEALIPAVPVVVPAFRVNVIIPDEVAA